jgi:hypothetical protein
MPSVKWSVATSIPIGDEQGVQSVVPTFAPQKIAYFKILYNGGNYIYETSTCGYYNLPVPTGIDGFVSDLISYETPQGSMWQQIDPDGLDFELGADIPCYVVFHLASGTVWQYRFNADGITTDDVTNGEYINLVHVDQHGNKRYGTGIVTPDPNNNTPPSTPFRVAYFSACAKSQKGGMSTPQPDNFNIYYYKGGQNQTIDPAIKNDGRGGVHTHTMKPR